MIRYAFVAALALSCVAAPVPSAAQYGEPASIEEIQVTAARRPAAVSDVSAALTLITSAEVRSSKLTTDALASRTGVYLQQTTPGQGAAIIRGLKGSEILHIVDGLRLNNAIFRNAPTQYLALVSPGFVDRIEVLRGASASLYGSDAVGGIIHVLSRVPAFDGSGTQFRRSVSIGFDTAEIGKSLRASLDAGNSKLAGLISIDYQDTGNRRTGSGERTGPTGYDSRGARVAVSSTPDARRSWLFDLQYAGQSATPRIDELVPGFGQSQPSSSEFLFAPNERLFAHVRHARADGMWAADWNFDFGWQRIVDDRVTRSFASSKRRYESNKSDLFGLTVSAGKEIVNGSWIVGVEVYHDRVRSHRVEEDNVSGKRMAVQPRFPDNSTIDQAAIYANVRRPVGDRNSVSGGLRLSTVDIDVVGRSSNITDFSADLGWMFRISDRAQLVANLAHGFRAPNIFDIGTLGERPGNRFNIPNPALDSEHVSQLDLGIRAHTDRSNAELVFYRLQYRDRISSVLTGAETTDGRDIVQSRNQARADIWGVEAAGSLAIRDKLTLDAILNFTRGEQRESAGPAVPADRIPPLNGRVALRYEPNESLTIEPFVLFADSQTRLSPRDARDVRIDPNGTSGWMTVNVRASWRPDERWSISAALENLFDDQYRHHGSGIDAVGRNLTVGFEANW
ncbi:MAG: TonB-dependent receptor plug domain-containing protein [Woeseia sp.]